MKNKFLHIVSTLEKNERTVVLILVSIIIFSGLVYSISLGNTLRYSDEQDYVTIANNLTFKGLYSIDGTHSTTYRPPGYPFMLSFFRFLGLNVICLRGFNYILFIITILLFYKILQKSFNTLAGLIAVFLIIFYPVLFYTAGTLYPQTLGSFLFIFFIYLLFYKVVSSIKYALLSGLVIGFLMLSIPTFIFVFVVSLIFLIFIRRNFITSSVIIMVAGIVIGAWTARNYFLFDAFIPFSTNSGYNLLLGNSPNTTANSGVNVDISKYAPISPDMNEIEQDVYCKSKAVKFIVENKQKAIVLYFKKVLNYFNYQNELATTNEASILRDLLMLFSYGLLLSLFILRIVFLRKYSLTSIEYFFIILYLLNAFFQAIFFTRIRFRLPFDYLLIGIVAIFISNILKKYSKAGTAKLTGRSN